MTTSEASIPGSPTTSPAGSTTLEDTTTSAIAATTTSTDSTTAVTQLPPPAKTCGVERWAVKTGMDPEAATVNQTDVTQSTIEALSALAAPSHPSARVYPTETTVFSVHATLTSFKLEAADSDYHLILDDGQGHTMITEIPSTDCIGTSPFKSAIGAVRAVFFSRFHPGPSSTATRTDVTVTGVGFFDQIHGQKGVPTNGIELHPALSIAFG